MAWFGSMIMSRLRGRWGLPRWRLPRSLFGRLALLFFLVMAVRDIGAYLLFHAMTDATRAQRQAAHLAIRAEALSELLLGLDAEDRAATIARMAQGRYLRLLPDGPDLPGQPLAPERRERVLEALQEQLGYPVDLRSAREGMWLRVQFAGRGYWLLSPRQPLERSFPWHWFAGVALMGILALLGAFLVVWRLNGPLRRLVEATTRLGQGKMTTLTVPKGPEELRALTVAFNHMQADLAAMEANRALLLAGVSHDLRTPLARLRLSLEMGVEEAELRAGMIQDIEEMGGLLDQFLDFAKSEQIEGLTKVDPDAVVAAVCARYARLGKGVHFRTGALPVVLLRPAAWQRLVTNLVDNAVRYGAGGDVDVETGRDGATFWLRVLDRGPGIPAAERARMMRPFTRLDGARSGGGRAGLGLAIVERIVHAHGGTVVLRDRDGGGLEARVVLPMTGQKAGEI